MNIRQTAKDIVNGKRLSKHDELNFLITCDLHELCSAADYIRQELCGDSVNLCTIINGKSGACSENCRFCTQSASSHSGCTVHNFLSTSEICAEAALNEQEGAHRFSIVTSGRALSGKDFEQSLEAYRQIRLNHNINLCASMGLVTFEQLVKLHEAGVTTYHCNLEASERFFPSICTTHTFADKIRTIQAAQKAGLAVCSGGIIGMGETWQDRIDMALTLANLNVVSIPVNILTAISGTPLQNRPPLQEVEILRTVAIFRFINPAKDIRLAGGRRLLNNNGRAAFLSGANAAITGNYLTTAGYTIAQDRVMLSALGRRIEEYKPAQ
ncbi:MAG: biotin synthase BioB [Treponema sp.]|uniref:biotin synthase BioB n=1 Tax=Treponema sp. TaxID=166 RepID=UPI003FA2C729